MALDLGGGPAGRGGCWAEFCKEVSLICCGAYGLAGGGPCRLRPGIVEGSCELSGAADCAGCDGA